MGVYLERLREESRLVNKRRGQLQVTHDNTSPRRQQSPPKQRNSRHTQHYNVVPTKTHSDRGIKQHQPKTTHQQHTKGAYGSYLQQLVEQARSLSGRRRRHQPKTTRPQHTGRAKSTVDSANLLQFKCKVNGEDEPAVRFAKSIKGGVLGPLWDAVKEALDYRLKNEYRDTNLTAKIFKVSNYTDYKVKWEVKGSSNHQHSFELVVYNNKKRCVVRDFKFETTTRDVDQYIFRTLPNYT